MLGLESLNVLGFTNRFYAIRTAAFNEITSFLFRQNTLNEQTQIGSAAGSITETKGTDRVNLTATSLNIPTNSSNNVGTVLYTFTQ